MAQYTEKAQEALVLASEAAEDMGSPVIGTEHILGFFCILCHLF